MKGRKPQEFTYMVVTADKYELPLAPPFDSAKELAEFLGVSRATIYNNIWSREKGRVNGNHSNKKYIKFKEDDEDV